MRWRRRTPGRWMRKRRKDRRSSPSRVQNRRRSTIPLRDISKSTNTKAAISTAALCKAATATARANSPARRITSPTTATGTWASAMAAARRKCRGSGGFPASFITISETASAGSFAPTAKTTRANGRTIKSTATAGKPMRAEAGTRANGSTAGARGRASIITLDAQGALHGEMLSADVDGFLKDFAW